MVMRGKKAKRIRLLAKNITSTRKFSKFTERQVYQKLKKLYSEFK